ncbi:MULTISPECIES: hypothetical protein [unclassified Streptomyces]|uniref:hypothetical protein n=1 Tax=unclassified Streptomyces TaxID=2593676 RepID=UPI002B1D67A1|nr:MULTISPECIES: hypothetical protein [unclassified Streptomyces]
MHAGEIETSILLHGTTPYTPTGVIGFPSHATPAKGKAVLNSLLASFTAHLEALLR